MKRGIAPAIAIGLTAIILAAPQLKLSKTDEALRQKTLSNAKLYATAVAMYCADYDDVTPYTSNPKVLNEIVYPYMQNRSVQKTLNPKGGIFNFNPSTTKVSISSIPEPSRTPFLYETNTWKDGKRVIAFWDTRATTVNEAEWTKLKKNLSLKIKKVK